MRVQFLNLPQNGWSGGKLLTCTHKIPITNRNLMHPTPHYRKTSFKQRISRPLKRLAAFIAGARRPGREPHQRGELGDGHVAWAADGCGSKLDRRGKPQVLVQVSTYQGSILVPVSHSQIRCAEWECRVVPLVLDFGGPLLSS